MKKLFALLFLIVNSWGITNVTLPYIIDTASVPKVKYVDKNDSALKWGVNNLGDSVNAATGTGSLVRKSGPTLTGKTNVAKLTASDSIVGTKGVFSDSIIGTKGIFSDTLKTLGRLVAGSIAKINLAGSFFDNVTTLTGNATLNTTTHSIILLDATAGNFTVTLPTAVGNAGLTYSLFKKNSTHNVILTTTGGQTIGGLGGAAFFTNVSGESIVSDGANWQLKDAYELGTFGFGLHGNTNDSIRGWSGNYWLDGTRVTVTLAAATGTSNANTFTLDTLPIQIRPANTQMVRVVVEDAGINVGAMASIASTGIITFYMEVVSGTKVTYSATGFTASGTKGISALLGITSMTLTYSFL